ncbi:MAG: ATP-grasp domain-containing protein [Arenicellales bacterium WSBS_2016_MAG_OTU3]
MDVLEYRAKQLLARDGIKLPSGGAATSAAGARDLAANIDANFWMVKAQILAGDRAQGGGVLKATTLDEVEECANRLLGSHIVTRQTDANGELVEKIYVEQGCVGLRQFYVSVAVDTLNAALTLLAAEHGGADVEDFSRQYPGKVFQQGLSLQNTPGDGIGDEIIASVCTHLNVDNTQQLSQIINTLHDALRKHDATLIEINPLVLTTDNEFIALDIKLALDDNALSRHPEFERLKKDVAQTQFRDREQSGFNYQKLNGNIGCLITGAGLALATLDMIHHHGGRAANFLDLPPSATAASVANAYALVNDDNDARCIYINVVGGGMLHCNTVADGLVQAIGHKPPRVPLVVRFSGTGKDYAERLIKNASIDCDLIGDYKTSVQRCVALADAKPNR